MVREKQALLWRRCWKFRNWTISRIEREAYNSAFHCEEQVNGIFIRTFFIRDGDTVNTTPPTKKYTYFDENPQPHGPRHTGHRHAQRQPKVAKRGAFSGLRNPLPSIPLPLADNPVHIYGDDVGVASQEQPASNIGTSPIMHTAWSLYYLSHRYCAYPAWTIIFQSTEYRWSCWF